MRYLVLLLIVLICSVACQPQTVMVNLQTEPSSQLAQAVAEALTQTALVPTETPLGYIPASAFTAQAALPTETPQGYIPPLTETLPYATSTPMPMFFVNGGYTTQAWPEGEVVLFWDVPQASEVWIAQQTMGVWCPGDIVLKPDMVYGPLPPTGYQRITIPPAQDRSLWFELYTDGNGVGDCGSGGRSTFLSANVEILHIEPSATSLPDEYFLVDYQAPRSIDAEGNKSYQTPYGSCISLRWSQQTDLIYLEIRDTAEGQPKIYGPLPHKTSLEVCPISGSSYTLYAGGKPGEVTGQTINTYQSPGEFQYFHGTICETC